LHAAAMKADLELVSTARLLFGHQSVGRDILDGVKSLADEVGVAIRIEEASEASSSAPPGLFHAYIGENGNYESKCLAFERLLTLQGTAPYDVAMMKFCYVDIDRRSAAPEAMLSRYVRMVDGLRARYPNLRLVHVTMPLRAKPSGWKNTVKRILGRKVPQDSYNLLRNRFNASLRERFSGEPLFDLAALESTLPDGRRVAFKLGGETVYTLAPQYSRDGGHLLPHAQRAAAAEFLRVVSAVLRQKVNA